MMKKVWLIAAIVLILVGSLAFVGAMALSGFDFSVLNSQEQVSSTYEFKDTIEKIVADVNTTDIRFLPSEDNACKVVCLEKDKLRHAVYVNEKTLFINLADTRDWYEHIEFFSSEMKITVYLPADQYFSLEIETDTGDISMEDGVRFSFVAIEGDTADVTCLASVGIAFAVELDTGDITIDSNIDATLRLSTGTGDIQVKNINTPQEVWIETETGDITLNNAACMKAEIDSETGDVTLTDVVTTDRIRIETDTGDVELDRCDAPLLSIQTSSGDVSGSVLTEKTFFTETSTGRVRVPQTNGESICQVKTSTGDIMFSVAGR
jgi:hypothetical protein